MAKFFTSEAVTEGHPDKVCDQISDAILDDVLAHDENARVACETVCTTGMVFVFGEITSNYIPDYSKIVRNTVTKIGYVRGKFGFDADNLAVLTAIDPQSPDIAMGVKEEDGHDQGAGDQGMMFGYATNETKELMPTAYLLAQKLARRLAEVRKDKTLPYLRPDGKTQVTVEYDDNFKVKRIDTILMSSQHDPDVTLEQLAEDLKREVVLKVIPSELLDENTKYLFNPTGRFVIGGPAADSGLTGRKIIVDTYGGASRHGGGSFSGKDPSKVDRTATYMCRYIAKNLVASHMADRLEVQLAYAIGRYEPVSISISTFGTGHYSDETILKVIERFFDLRPGAIIEKFSLLKPSFKYADLSNYGHFGRPDLDLPWEKLDLVPKIEEFLQTLPKNA